MTTPRYAAWLQDHDQFTAVLTQLHEAKHTGAVVIHMLHGKPRTVEIPSTPQRFILDAVKK